MSDSIPPPDPSAGKPAVGSDPGSLPPGGSEGLARIMETQQAKFTRSASAPATDLADTEATRDAGFRAASGSAPVRGTAEQASERAKRCARVVAGGPPYDHRDCCGGIAGPDREKER